MAARSPPRVTTRPPFLMVSPAGSVNTYTPSSRVTVTPSSTVMLGYTPGGRLTVPVSVGGTWGVGGGVSWSGVRRPASGSATGGPPSSGVGMNSPAPVGGGNPPMTLIWSALTSPPADSTRATGLAELTAMPPPVTSTPPPRPSTFMAPVTVGSSTQSTQLLGAAGPAPAVARALIAFELLPRIGANA